MLPSKTGPAFIGSTLILFLSMTLQAQTLRRAELPRIVQKDGRYSLFVDGAPFLILGMQANNSSAWPATMPGVWKAAESLHANTVEVPIYWEQFEPARGVFDDSLLRLALHGARTHHQHLVLLWFGTWKNGSGHYTPLWMKQNNNLYPRVVDQSGKNIDSLSPLGSETLQADKTAFARLMSRIRALDQLHTVIMIQVENESGSYGSVRDFSPAAQAAFQSGVPTKLLAATNKNPGTWTQVFGSNADEFFHAWMIATYINQVAAAGKKAYPLPMYVNAALRDPLHPGPANTYESGGPTDNVIALWKTAAPSVDLIGPDIYMPEYEKVEKVMEFYGRKDNALFISEIDRTPEYARYLYSALGHGAIGFSTFGMDNAEAHVTGESVRAFADKYRVVASMQRRLAILSFDGKVHGVSEDPASHDHIVKLDGWQATVSFGRPYFGFGSSSVGNLQPIGGALIAQIGPSEFIVTATHARVDFSPLPANSNKQRQFLRVEEGYFEDEQWKFTRILNGDQTDYGLNFDARPQVLKVSVGTF